MRQQTRRRRTAPTKGLLEGNEEGWAKTLGDPNGEGPADALDNGPEAGTLLQLGLLEGDEEGCAETLVTPPTATSKVRQMDETTDGKKALCSNWACSKATVENGTSRQRGFSDWRSVAVARDAP